MDSARNLLADSLRGRSSSIGDIEITDGSGKCLEAMALVGVLT